MENQTPQNPIQEPVQSSISVPIPTKGSNRIIVLFSVLLLILLVSTGFLYYQNMNLQKQVISLKEIPTPSVSPTILPATSPPGTPDPTSAWKTYTNTNYGFEFKYPFSLTEDSSEGAPGVSGPITNSSISNTITNVFDTSELTDRSSENFDGFSIYEIDTNLITNFTYASYLNSELTAIKNSPRGVQTATIQQISLGNQSYSYIDSEINIRRYFILSPDGKKLIIFSRTNNTSVFPSIFNQILSTFKFTN
jgi:hypothetical protein